MGGFDKIEFTPVKQKKSLTDKKGENFAMSKRVKKRNGFRFSKKWFLALFIVIVLFVNFLI